MCIAIYVPTGVEAPDEATLKRCFTSNDEGAGFAFYDPEKEVWSIDKGYMTWDEFWEGFSSYNFQKEVRLLIHFRISTSGKRKDPDCTHPFPIVEDYETMMQHKQKTECLLVHNGVCGSGWQTASDTMVAVKEVIDPLHKYLDDPKIQKMMTAILKSTTNKWAIAIKDKLFMFGDWEEDEGVFYSNTGYKEYDYSSYQRNWSHHRSGTSVIGINREHQRNCPWNNRNDDEEEEHHVIYMVMDRSATSFMGKKKQNRWAWNWVDFDKYLTVPANLHRMAEHSAESVLMDENNIALTEEEAKKRIDESETAELYDADGQCIAVCDIHGNVLWEANDDIRHFSSGIPAKSLQEGCPNCGDEANIVPAMKVFNIGDSLCCRCGCIFLDTKTGDDSVVGWDYDTKHEYDKIQKLGEGA